MNIPSEVKPACWGAVAGAIGLAVIGFGWGGWVTGSTADQKAKLAAETAAVTALAPYCVEKFRTHADSAGKLAELKKLSDWQKSGFVEQGGWATLLGSTTPNSSLAKACATLLEKPKA